MASVRRSGRERKPVEYFSSAPDTRKRKHGTDTEDVEDDDDHASNAGSDSEEDEYTAKKSSGTSMTRKSKPRAHQPSPTKKPRTAKATSTSRVPRKPKDSAAPPDSTSISDDNPLFNAVLNPSAALQSTVEDYLQSLELSPNPALAELVNFVLRACGSNDSVDADQVIDSDGIIDVLDHFTEALKHNESPMYPLTSKLPAFKKFRKSLCEFLERLVSSAAETGSLYTDELMDTLKEWVIAMSSSQIRSFRHTATVIVLELQTALCRVAATLEKESDRVSRQREGEKKRKGNNKSGSAKGKDLENKADQLRVRRTQVAALLKEFFNGVFIHRYRDTDALIRADCVKSLGSWFQRFPSEFLTGDYLRYVGWVLSDPSSPVRIEAVRALLGVYGQVEHASGLNHFTERFKPRLIQMATKDTDLSIRAAVIQVLIAIDDQSFMDDEERQTLCTLAKDVEPKVRKAVAHFVKNVWEEMVETKLTEKPKPTAKDKERVGFKVFGSLLAQLHHEEDGTSEESLLETDAVSERVRSSRHAAALFQLEQPSEISLIIESLWDEFDVLHDWEGLLDMLLRDHTSSGEVPVQGSPRKGRKKSAVTADASESSVDEMWRLEDEEEGLLLQALLSALRLAQSEAANGKKDEEEKVVNDMTRALINALPRLFLKHQTDEKRIDLVLRLPHLMNLDMYLDMRMLSNYSALWDDVTKQFFSHSSPSVLRQAMGTIQRCMAATSLSKTNSEKILELEEELSASLRDVIGGRDELDLTNFSEDELLALTSASARIDIFTASRDMSGWIEEDEGGKQSSAWDIVNALVDRGRLGHKEEEAMFGHTIQILSSYIFWKYQRLLRNPEADDSEHVQEILITNRDSIQEKLFDFALGGQTNATEGVKRTAFRHYMDLQVLFSWAEDSSLALSLDDETQYRCAGFMQAEIERYADALYTPLKATDDDEDEDEASDQDDEEGPKLAAVDIRSTQDLGREYSFMDVISSFVRAIVAGCIHIRHSAILLPYCHRLGPQFDQFCKKIVLQIRDEGLSQKQPDIIVNSVSQAMKEAFAFTLTLKPREDIPVQLPKLLATSFTLRGSQLVVVKRLSSSHIADIHGLLFTWIGDKLRVFQEDHHDILLRKTVKFFRTLIPLVTGMDSRDALKVKAQLSQTLAEKKVDVSDSKLWDPLRSYEKRLGTALTKEKVKTRQKKQRKDDGLPTSEEESEVEHLVDDPEESQQQSQPRPRPRPIVNGQATLHNADEVDETAPTATPKEGSRPLGSSISPSKATPKSRKRARLEDSGANESQLAVDDAVSISSREPTPAGDVIIPKRRRLRH